MKCRKISIAVKRMRLIVKISWLLHVDNYEVLLWIQNGVIEC